MQKLREFIHVNQKFQKSINLRLDYNRQEKITGYIPTRASLQVLSAYLEKFTGENRDRASILIGPYGKGKSQLLLILLALLSKENKNKQFIKEIIDKLGNGSKEAQGMAQKLYQSDAYYLPVILTGAQRDFHRSLLLSLRESLEREGLTELAPDTYFQQAEKTIDMWEARYPDTYREFLGCLKQLEVKEKEFRKGLRMYDENTLQAFQKIYPRLTAGSVFDPMVQTDVISLYRTVNEALHHQYGYQGMVLIFDEFSKFVEGYPKEKFAAAMEELQDLCELSANSREEELHIILVAHKAMKEYKNVLPNEVVNSYMGVEGRISEIFFTTSLKNSYELIENAIIKEDVPEWKQIQDSKEFLDIETHGFELPYFQALFQKEEFTKTMAQGCYPLTPISAYLLLKISEQAVQNERTVFTFLSNDEPYSLVRFLKEKNKEFLTAAWVYDYFSKICRGDTANVKIHNEWLKAEYALQKLEDEKERTVIKTIALIRMVGKGDEIFARDEVIRLGAGLSEAEYQQAITGLKEKELILFRSKSGSYAFKNNIGVDLEKEMQQVVARQYQDINVCEVVRKYSELTYELPKRYNLKYTMTRYFKYHFMTVEQFLQLKNSEYLFEEQFSDGKILALILSEKTEAEKIREKLMQLQDKRVIVLLPKEVFAGTDKLQKLCALEYLKQSQEFVQENKALLQELSFDEEDLLFELQVYLESYFLPSQGGCQVLYDATVYPEQQFFQNSSDAKFNQFLSNIFEDYYGEAPIINNELINRRRVSSQMKKARQRLMRQILKGEDCSGYIKGTAPEATIYRAVFIRTGLLSFSKENVSETAEKDRGTQQVLKHMIEFFKSSVGEKRNFAVLYGKLLGQGYGARQGVLPLYLAYCISRLKALPVIYMGDREVKLDEKVLDQINDAPEKYYLYTEKSSYDKEAYLDNLERIFGREHKEEDKFNRLEGICEDIYHWYCALPQCSRTYSVEDKSEKVQRGVKRFRSIFSKIERNPREVLLVSLPAAFDAEDYAKLTGRLESFKQETDHYLCNLKNQVVYCIRKNFGFSKDKDLKKSFEEWYDNRGRKAEFGVNSRQVTEFLRTIRMLPTHDPQTIGELIVKSVLDIYIEDFKENSVEQFIEQIGLIKSEIEKSADTPVPQGSKIVFTNSQGREVQKYFKMEEEDGTSTFLQNEIESTLEEYGDSLEVNQKISVMVRMIEKLLEG